MLHRQRSQFEHAIATLTGTPAPSFSLAADIRTLEPPTVPIGVPTDVLERRPDVASAERAMAAANAQIGVATAAFYPSIILSPTLGVESTSLSTLFNASSLLWALGVSIAQPVIDSGRLNANLDFAKAGYDVTAANYRRVILTAMQEAEDGIVGLAALERASDQAAAAIVSSRRVFDLATARYEGGIATYLDVITAQQACSTPSASRHNCADSACSPRCSWSRRLAAIGPARRRWRRAPTAHAACAESSLARVSVHRCVKLGVHIAPHGNPHTQSRHRAYRQTAIPDMAWSRR